MSPVAKLNGRIPALIVCGAGVLYYSNDISGPHFFLSPTWQYSLNLICISWEEYGYPFELMYNESSFSLLNSSFHLLNIVNLGNYPDFACFWEYSVKRDPELRSDNPNAWKLKVRASELHSNSTTEV